jgi:hypothetical protein
VIRTGFIWLRIGPPGGSFKHGNEPFGSSDKFYGIFRRMEELVACFVGTLLCFTFSDM